MRKSCMTAVLSMLVATGCGGAPPEQQTDAEPADAKEIGSAKQPIINGWAIDENHSGHVKLEVFSSDFNDWFVYCSGTLMTNGWMFTAAHCFDPAEIGTRRPNIRMGSQVTRAATVWKHPDLDLALVTLESPLDMWNWTGSSHATNPPQINNWQYARSIVPSSASVGGKSVLCTGIAPGGFGAPIRAGFFTAVTHSDEFVTVAPLAPFNQSHDKGDSGGGCLTDWFLYSSPIMATMIGGFPGVAANGYGSARMLDLFWQVWFGLPPLIVY